MDLAEGTQGLFQFRIQASSLSGKTTPGFAEEKNQGTPKNIENSKQGSG
jgi:hypothetical protein